METDALTGWQQSWSVLAVGEGTMLSCTADINMNTLQRRLVRAWITAIMRLLFAWVCVLSRTTR